MEKYKLVNKWEEIQNLNWFELAKLHNDKNANKALAHKLIKKYNIQEISELLNFVVDKRKIMSEFIYKWLDDNHIPSDKFTCSDDGIWDLSSHIVGLGYTMYETVLQHPEILLQLQNDYVENFEYGFDEAIYMLSSNEL